MTTLKCLIVDDQQDKRDRVRQTIELEVGNASVHIDAAGSANEAAEKLRIVDYDLLVVDLNLPMRNGETAVADGGTRLLRQVARGAGGLKRPLCIVGLTAYEDLAEVATGEFHRYGWALITYSPESAEWEEMIVNQCVHIAALKII